MAKEKDEPFFVFDADGNKLVRIDSFTNPMNWMYDGLGMTLFDGDERPYAKLEDAIEFVRKNPRDYEPELHVAILGTMERFAAATA